MCRWPWATAVAAVLSFNVAAARGVSPYLPLDLEPEMDRLIERVLVLADRPALSRPFAAATVLDALPAACARDEELCAVVRRYLSRFIADASIAHASVEGAITSGVDEVGRPNRRGIGVDGAWTASLLAIWQPLDHALIALGGVADEDVAVPTGSIVSVGWDFLQLDAGFRDRRLSPFADGAMLVSTEAETLPSVTLSNYRPLTRLGLRYEVFLAEMSYSDRIAFEERTTAGNPRLFGMHVSMEPASGWMIGVNRILQYGGGEREDSFWDMLDAFFNPAGKDNLNPITGAGGDFGNQVASVTSAFLFPGRVPFSVYFEYAGEDTSRGRNWQLGNAALSAGIRFPSIARRFDLTLEATEWQNGWYVSGIYGDGLTHEGRTIGHWFGNSRVTGDAIGGRSGALKLGWRPPFGGDAELEYRTIRNEDYGTFDYTRGEAVSVRYARPVGPYWTIGGEALAGRDVFDEDTSRFALFMRYSPQGTRAVAFAPELAAPGAADPTAEVFIAAGVTGSEVEIDLDSTIPTRTTDVEAEPHVAIGARRAVSARNDLGVRIEFDQADGRSLVAVRALDYRYRFDGPLAFTAFLGAARYDAATPAYGIYGGLGVQWRDIVPRWDLGLEARYANDVARDDLLPSDPIGDRPDSFYSIRSVAVVLSRRF